MRTIIVGDVHGCAAELEDLLDKVAFATGDRLVFVGDLVARGPASLAVLDIVRRTGALLVRGNHEQKLLDWHQDPNANADVGKLHRELAAALRPIDWSLIKNAPVSLELPEHDVRVVHAGIDPSLPFDQQDSGTMMRIRTVPGAAKKEQVLWGERYVGPPHIVFGHNAAPGLQLHPFATGLDTGCVYGGRLTAIVLAANQSIPEDVATRKTMLTSVAAQRMWFEPAQHARRAMLA